MFGSESVVGSNVMVSVAKNFDGPIKLLFPRTLPTSDIAESVLGSAANAADSTIIKGAEKACVTVVKDLARQLSNEGGSKGLNMTVEGAKLIIAAGRSAYATAPECKEVVSKDEAAQIPKSTT